MEKWFYSLLGIFLISSANAQFSVSIEGIKNNRGVVQLAIWDSSTGFPEEYQKAVLLKTLSLDELEGYVIPEIKPGTYAMAVYHDENEDLTLNRNVFGIPREGFGFSNNPRIRFGPPSFSQAAFIYNSEESLVVKLNYP